MKKLIEKYKKNKLNKRFSKYPAVDYLKNAIIFINEGKGDYAIREIYYAMQKAGVPLTLEQINFIDKQNKREIK